MIKKIGIALAVILVLLVAAMAAVPYFFKDEIVDTVKTTANESLTAKLDFKDVDVSLFRHFPKIAVGLDEITVTGTGKFQDIRLLYAKRIDVAIDLWSAIFGDNVKINGVYLDEPDIRVYVLSDGSANYDITKPSTEPETTAATTEESPIQLEHYAITNGHVLYDDRSLDMRADLSGLNHEGSGEFTSNIFDFVTKTQVQGFSVNYGGMQYLSNAKLDWDATLNANLISSKYTLKENTLQLNALKMLVDGWVSLPNDEDILMDIKFSTPSNTFKSFLSLVPGAYTQDFDQVQANGTLAFAGLVKGKYNETTYPAFNLDLKVKNADFKYPSLPLGVSNINVDCGINSPSSSLDAMTVKIPAFSLKIGSNPIEGYFNLKKPESDPTVDTKIKGTLNLAELSKAFPMDGVKEMSGTIRANILAKAAMSQIDRQAYEEVTMAGDFSIKDMVYRSTDMPVVRINSLNTGLSPQRLEIREFNARLGKSDLRADGAIDNLLAYFSPNKTMTGTLNFNSTLFDANEWMEEEPATTPNGAPDPGKVPSDVPAPDEKAFDQWDFTVDGRIARLKYEDYDLNGLVLKGHFKPNKMDISEFAMKIGQSDLSGNGQVLNAWNYLYDNQTVSGVLNLNSNFFDLNPFMTDETSATTAAKTAEPAEPVESGVVPIPENIDMTVNTNFKKVIYTDQTLTDLDGQVVVKDRTAKLKDFTAGILGGQVAVSGEYNTQNLAKPLFNVDLALQNMGFKEAYNNFVSIKKLAPIAQLIDGKFNTTMSMSGILGQDMTPDFNTLSAAGFLETINAMVNNFKPLNEIGTKLNVEYLKRLELSNTKNWFEVKDGKVIVKPFNVQVKDVAMQIGGASGIGGDMEYQILTKAPRKALGTAVNSGLSLLTKEASKYGVSLAQGEYINVRFDLTGKLANPKVSMKVLGSDGQSTMKEEAGAAGQALVDKAKDSLRTVASKELDKAKAKANQVADSLQRVAEQKAKEAANKAIEQGKQEVGKVLGKEVGDKVGNEAGKKAEEILGGQGKKNVDEVKDKLNEWDPFKKKKKEGGNR